MTGPAHWLPLALVLAVIALTALLWALDVKQLARFITVRRRLTCPGTGKQVEVELVEDAASGGFTGVRSCSRFTPPDAVHCAQKCKDEQEPVPIQVAGQRAPVKA
jgi:hypothetical protein